jgi:hypothetical protein
MSHYTNPFTVVAKPSSTFQTDNISNSTATEDSSNKYNICQRTGFRVKPYQLRKEWNGSLVRDESWEQRHPQEFIRPLAEDLHGAQRPESSDTFLAASIAPEDL